MIGNTKGRLYSKMSKSIKAIKPVYCYYFPEVRAIVSETLGKFDHQLIRESIFPGLDNYHERLLDKFVQKSAGYQKGLEDYPCKYICNGSSEAIFHLLVEAGERGLPIYVLSGEYEGYREYAKNIGLRVTEVDTNWEEIKRVPKGRWFISNPSARDGNIIDNGWISKLGDLGHELVIDVAYLGLTPRKQIDLSHQNIVAVVASMSKPFGMFYFRVGFAFSRKPLLTLSPNKWFKNILMIQLAENILDKIEFGSLWRRYHQWQTKAVQELARESGENITASEVLLLAHADTKNKQLSDYQRGNQHRFCLTPYYLEFENSKSL